MMNLILVGLRTTNELITAGVAITAFSLLLYVLTFNLNDRVTRSFAIVLSCMAVAFVGETLKNVIIVPNILTLVIKIQWIGIIFLPAAYLQFSDALLETTGRPSRGRRRLAVLGAYSISFIFFIILVLGWFTGPLVDVHRPVPHLATTPFFWIFSIGYILSMVFAWVGFVRAFKRTVTHTTRRRMIYLLAGALAPVLGSIAFLLFSAGLAALDTILFWFSLVLSNIAILALLVVLSYAVAFFGVSWPDRVIKRRLAKWLLRGPVTVSLVLAMTTFVRRIGLKFGLEYTALVPFVMVGSILILEHLITLTAPLWERLLFRGSERVDVNLLQTLEERLLTSADLQQFLESLLATVCDRLQVSHAFVASFDTEGLDILVSVGGESLNIEDFSTELLEVTAAEILPTLQAAEPTLSRNLSTPVTMSNGTDLSNSAALPDSQMNSVQNNLPFTDAKMFVWGDYWLVPLFDPDHVAGNGATTSESKMIPVLLGILGIQRKPEQVLDDEQKSALAILIQRGIQAIRDRYLEKKAFNSLEALTPQIEMIQRLRAAARYGGAEVLTSPNPDLPELETGHLTLWVKDALTDFWGGPKLTQSPLMNLKVVQEAVKTNKDNPTNALRQILKQAIERTRPEGERRFTADWILYNILELKFLQGQKVREIAQKLAMSEADLYRKQRVAIEAVSKTILEMEEQARQ